MLKYCDVAVTFTEFPDEIALCVNISNCPCRCISCSEPWLKEDIGEFLTEEAIDDLVRKHPGCTTFGLMGGDSDHDDIVRIAKYIHATHGIKVGFYSGRNYLDTKLVPFLDFYKIGPWVEPHGEPSNWWREACGPLCFPFSNQVYFEIKDGVLINSTNKFRRAPLNDLTRYIVTPK